MSHFEKEEQFIVASQVDPEALGGVAQRAKKFLSELPKYPQVTDIQKEKY